MSCQLSQIDSTDVLIPRNDSRSRPTDRKSRPLKSRGCVGSNGFKKILTCANQGPNHAFGSGLTLDFEPNFGPVRESSGSNLGSEPDCGSTNDNTIDPQLEFYDFVLPWNICAYDTYDTSQFVSKGYVSERVAATLPHGRQNIPLRSQL